MGAVPKGWAARVAASQKPKKKKAAPKAAKKAGER